MGSRKPGWAPQRFALNYRAVHRPCFVPRSRHAVSSLLLLGSLACSATPPHETGTSWAKVEGGNVDAESKHVFRVLARVTGFNELCSATLIAPQLMLTARHCVAPTPNTNVNCETDRFGPTVAPTELKFSNDVEPNLTSRWFDAHSVLVSSDSDFTCGYDIAVVLLTQPVPSGVAEPAIPRFFPTIQRGETYSAVGYGGSDADENAAEYGIRHSRNGLSVTCGQSNNCADNSVAAQEFIGSEGACKGDSGGPALDDDGQVIGVLSRGAEGCESPIYVGVPAFETLLVAAAEQANRALGAPLPVWAGGDPPPVPITPSASSEPSADATGDSSPPDDEGESDGEEQDAKEREPISTLPSEGCAVVPGNQRPHGAWLAFLAIAALSLGYKRVTSACSSAARRTPRA